MLQVLETPNGRRRSGNGSQHVWESQRYLLEDDGTTIGASPGLEKCLLDELLAQQLQQEENMGDMGRSGDDTWRLLTEQMLRLQFQQFDPHVRYAASSSRRSLPVPPDHYVTEVDEESYRSDTPSDTNDNDIIVVAEPPSPGPPPLVTCGICRDDHIVERLITIRECNHSFCQGCLRSQVGYKIANGRYPIFCPSCEATYSRSGYTKLSDEHFKELDLPVEQLENIVKFQLLPHAITMQCPRCSEIMEVDRKQYIEERVLVCPLRRCGHKWCKDCQKTLPSSERRHHCKARNINYLMRFKGWKRCPGCLTPVQKESGCNHIVCSAPGCNVHFCYRCGELIVDTSETGEVGSSVNEHYAKCRQFDRELLGISCNIIHAFFSMDAPTTLMCTPQMHTFALGPAIMQGAWTPSKLSHHSATILLYFSDHEDLRAEMQALLNAQAVCFRETPQSS